MASYSRYCGCVEDSTENVKCDCGEDVSVYEWIWEETTDNKQVQLSTNHRDVHFHPGISIGTAAVRGNLALHQGRQYFWEIKMLSTVYGTDVMVGVGTARVNLTAHANEFCSLLGKDSESWGFSYRGDIKHAGIGEEYGPSFGKGSIVGVHLDMWKGTVEFYVNRERIGVAFKVNKNQSLFPMVCSTVANSAMRLVSSMSWPTSLELSCLQSISSLPALAEVPGLRAIWGSTPWWRNATEMLMKVEENLYPDSPILDLEVLSSDEEEQGRIFYKPRKSSYHPERKLKCVPPASKKLAQIWHIHEAVES